MVKCKRCKKFEAVAGKKLCVACREYSRIYMKEMRAKKKVFDAVKVLKLRINEKLPNIPMVINENPDYVFAPEIDDSGTIFAVGHKYDSDKKTLVNVNNENVNKNNVNKNNVNKNNVNKSEISSLNFRLPEGNLNFNEIKLSPEDFRYFYFRITGKVFRENKIECIKELVKYLELELKISI